MDITYQAVFLFALFNICLCQRPRLIFVDEEGKAQCPCTRIFFPVCGTDGRTYNNKCLLQCQGYIIPNLALKHEGDCRSKRSSSSSHISNQLNQGECPCPPEKNFVCGTDGVTYKSPCHLKCKSYPGTTVKHAGPCAEMRRFIEKMLYIDFSEHKQNESVVIQT